MRALLALAALGGANAFAPSQQPRATLVRRHAIKVKVEVDIPALWDGDKEAAYKVGDLAGAVAGGGGDASAVPPADPLAKINATVASIQRFPSDVEAKAAATAASVTKTIDDIQALPGRVTDKVDDTVDEAKRTAARIKSIPSRVRSSVDETTKSVTDAVDFVADLPARAQRTADGVTRTVTQTVETAEKTAAAVSGVASAVASAPSLPTPATCAVMTRRVVDVVSESTLKASMGSSSTVTPGGSRRWSPSAQAPSSSSCPSRVRPRRSRW